MVLLFLGDYRWVRIKPTPKLISCRRDHKEAKHKEYGNKCHEQADSQTWTLFSHSRCNFVKIRSKGDRQSVDSFVKPLVSMSLEVPSKRLPIHLSYKASENEIHPSALSRIRGQKRANTSRFPWNCWRPGRYQRGCKQLACCLGRRSCWSVFLQSC